MAGLVLLSINGMVSIRVSLLGLDCLYNCLLLRFRLSDRGHIIVVGFIEVALVFLLFFLLPSLLLLHLLFEQPAIVLLLFFPFSGQ